MKYLLLLSFIVSFNASGVELVIGALSTHIGDSSYPHKYVSEPNVKFNSNHKALGLMYASGLNSIVISKFKNSYHRNSKSVSFYRQVGFLHVGASVATGYDVPHIKSMKDNKIIVAPSIRYDFNNITVYTLGKAVAFSFKLKL